MSKKKETIKLNGKFMFDMVAKWKAKMALKNMMMVSAKEADKVLDTMRIDVTIHCEK